MDLHRKILENASTIELSEAIIKLQNELNSIKQELAQERYYANHYRTERETLPNTRLCKYWVDPITGNLKQMYDLTPANLQLTFSNGKLVEAKVLK